MAGQLSMRSHVARIRLLLPLSLYGILRFCPSLPSQRSGSRLSTNRARHGTHEPIAGHMGPAASTLRVASPVDNAVDL